MMTSDFEGGFYGTSAQEVGGHTSFEMTGIDDGEAFGLVFNGSFIGAEDTE